MNAATLLFYFFMIVAALSAIAIVFVKNIFYGALWLIVCLLSIAAIYVLAVAEFLAVTQILIYAGGILVVIIFGIMLTSKLSGVPLRIRHTSMFSGAVVAIVFAGLLCYFYSRENFSSASDVLPPNTIQGIGVELMGTFMFPFEVAGILLLVALLGAVVIASSTKTKRT